MIKASKGNIFIKIESFDVPSEEDAIRKFLTFAVPNFWFMTSFRKRIWDGTYCFYNDFSQTFPTGLFDIFPDKLKDRFVMNDARRKPEFVTQELKLEGIQLRDYQIDAIQRAFAMERCILTAPTNAGKSQPLDALVYTTKGPVQMGKIKVGDEILTPMGDSTTVTGVYPQGLLDIYRVTFRNGDSVECSLEHLWKIGSRINWTIREKVVALNSIMGSHLQKSGRPKYQIYPAKPVEFVFAPVVIHPYLLGVLLGDGSLDKNGIRLSCGDKAIVSKARRLLPGGYQLKQSGRIVDYVLSKQRRGGGNVILDALRKYGLCNRKSWEKFIPDVYKYNSGSVRMELLNGLMDTDGYSPSRRSGVEFCSTSLQLAMDVKEVAESLGAVCRIRSKIPKFKYLGKLKEGKRSYVVTFGGKLAHRAFSLPRKWVRVLVGEKHQSRVITEIEYVGRKECRCISSHHPEHMYLTNHFIPTHNTEIGAGLMKIAPVKVLWLTHRGNLLYQTRDRLAARLNEDIGVVHRNAMDIKRVTVGMVQTLFNRVTSKNKEIKAMFKDWLWNEVDMLLIDECLDGDTEIAVPEGIKLLKELRVGDVVLTPKGVANVKRVWKTVKPAFKYWLNSGNYLIASDDHYVPIIENRGLKIVKIREAKKLLVPRKLSWLSSHDKVSVRSLYKEIKITNIQFCDETELYDIEIDSNDHLFFANGFVVSNCHHQSAATWFKVSKNINAFYRFGLSATPLMREEIQNLRLISMTGEEIKTITNREMIMRGFSAAPKIYRIKNFSLKFMRARNWQAAYIAGIELNNDRNNIIAGIARLHKLRKEPVLILIQTFRHARELLSRMTNGTILVSGLTEAQERNQKLAMLERNEIPAIVATPIFDEGMDLPAIKVLILAGAGKSHMKLLQRIGRGMRKKPSGENVVRIYDFEDRGDRYLEAHSVYRLSLYRKEGFDVIPTQIKTRGR